MRCLSLLAGSCFFTFCYAEEPKWLPLFNGKDLSGWTPKIAKHPLGENFAETFRVDDGMIKVAYDRYAKFDQQYGHLFTNLAYSRYVLRMEYRFAGKMMADAPKYVNLNSGVMLHAQPPQSMGMEQGFPSSLEFQFLADEGKGPRPTGNVCSPGTNLEMGGKLITQHIVSSKAPTLLRVNRPGILRLLARQCTLGLLTSHAATLTHYFSLVWQFTQVCCACHRSCHCARLQSTH